MVTKKAQGWGFDLMIASILFLAGILTFYLYSINYPTESQETLETLFYEGNFISDSLLSEGFPDNWKEEDVIKIGLLNENKINETKLETLYDMAHPVNNPQGYVKSKSLFNTKYDYFFNFSVPIEFNGGEIPEGGIGKSFSNEETQNLIKITRLTIYRNKPETLNLYVWE